MQAPAAPSRTFRGSHFLRVASAEAGCKTYAEQELCFGSPQLFFLSFALGLSEQVGQWRARQDPQCLIL